MVFIIALLFARGRRMPPFALLATVALCLLLANPLTLFQPGFQLSLQWGRRDPGMAALLAAPFGTAGKSAARDSLSAHSRREPGNGTGRTLALSPVRPCRLTDQPDCHPHGCLGSSAHRVDEHSDPALF